MDSGTVKTLCDSAARLVTALSEYAATEPAKHTPEDDAMVRQLRVAVASISAVLSEVPRKLPPMPRPPDPPRPADVGQPA